MRRLVKILLFFSLGSLVMAGCSTEEAFESFTLSDIGTVSLDDAETPIRYMVSPSRAEDQVIILRNERANEMEIGINEETYDLEKVTVTDKEIVIEYEGQTETFERLSESVVQNEDRVQYQYRSTSEE